jgi:hypothetical protein
MVCFLSIFILGGQTPDKELKPGKNLQELGIAFAKALHHEDIIGYAQCWMSSETGVQLIKQFVFKGNPERAEKHLKQHRKRTIRRNREIIGVFEKIIVGLKKETKDLTELSFKKIEAKGVRREKDDMLSCNIVEITVQTEAKKDITITINDATEWKGKWYLLDGPHLTYKVKEKGKEVEKDF